MSIVVESPDGTVLLDQTFPKFNEFTTYKSSTYTSSKDAENGKQSLLKTVEQKITDDNLRTMNDFENAERIISKGIGYGYI